MFFVVAIPSLDQAGVMRPFLKRKSTVLQNTPTISSPTSSRSRTGAPEHVVKWGCFVSANIGIPANAVPEEYWPTLLPTLEQQCVDMLSVDGCIGVVLHEVRSLSTIVSEDGVPEIERTLQRVYGLGGRDLQFVWSGPMGCTLVVFPPDVCVWNVWIQFNVFSHVIQPNLVGDSHLGGTWIAFASG